MDSEYPLMRFRSRRSVCSLSVQKKHEANLPRPCRRPWGWTCGWTRSRRGRPWLPGRSAPTRSKQGGAEVSKSSEGTEVSEANQGNKSKQSRQSGHREQGKQRSEGSRASKASKQVTGWWTHWIETSLGRVGDRHRDWQGGGCSLHILYFLERGPAGGLAIQGHAATPGRFLLTLGVSSAQDNTQQQLNIPSPPPETQHLATTPGGGDRPNTSGKGLAPLHDSSRSPRCSSCSPRPPNSHWSLASSYGSGIGLRTHH